MSFIPRQSINKLIVLFVQQAHHTIPTHYHVLTSTTLFLPLSLFIRSVSLIKHLHLLTWLAHYRTCTSYYSILYVRTDSLVLVFVQVSVEYMREATLVHRIRNHDRRRRRHPGKLEPMNIRTCIVQYTPN